MNIVQLFASLGGAPPALQYLRPIDDYNPGFSDWVPVGAAELWLCTDDVVPDEDATYARTPFDEIGDLMILQLSAGLGPVQPQLVHKFVVRMRYNGTPDSTPFVNLIFYGGPGQTNTILTVSAVSLTGSWADYEYVLTAPQIAKFVDYSAVLIAITPFWVVGGSSGVDVRCTQMFLQIGGEA